MWSLTISHCQKHRMFRKSSVSARCTEFVKIHMGRKHRVKSGAHKASQFGARVLELRESDFEAHNSAAMDIDDREVFLLCSTNESVPSVCFPERPDVPGPSARVRLSAAWDGAVLEM